MSNETMTLKVIAHIHTAFPTKFGIPRQSGLVDGLRGEIIFTPEYRNADALRGLEDFSHIWLVWQFSGAVRESWSPTVRPPRLGGNTRMGVFATRSPFRPNPLGLSSVRLEAIEHRPEVGPVLIVRGADLMDGTPIYDIKPYIPYADCHPDASAGIPLGQLFQEVGGGAGGLLLVGGQKSQTGELVNGGVLVQTQFRVGDTPAGYHLHIHLNPLAGIGHLLVGFGFVRLFLLSCGKQP